MAKRRLLIAATNEAYEKVASVLSDNFELSHSLTLEEAMDFARKNKPDAIICTLLFDESRMLDLLSAVKTDPVLSSIPFIACRAYASSLPESSLEGIEVTSGLLGAALFLDLLKLHEEHHDDAIVSLIKRTLPNNNSDDQSEGVK